MSLSEYQYQINYCCVPLVSTFKAIKLVKCNKIVALNRSGRLRVGSDNWLLLRTSIRVIFDRNVRTMSNKLGDVICPCKWIRAGCVETKPYTRDTVLESILYANKHIPTYLRSFSYPLHCRYGLFGLAGGWNLFYIFTSAIEKMESKATIITKKYMFFQTRIGNLTNTYYIQAYSS